MKAKHTAFSQRKGSPVPHLAGDPHSDECKELEVAVPQRLQEPGPDDSAASRAAEPHLPAATGARGENHRAPRQKGVNDGSPREGREEAAGEEGKGSVLDYGPEVQPLRGNHGM